MVKRGKELGRHQVEQRLQGVDGPTVDTKKESQRSGREPEESGSMDHQERKVFPKGSVNSSEAEQENDPKVPVRFGDKNAAGNLSEGPSVGTEADWGMPAVKRSGVDSEHRNN